MAETRKNLNAEAITEICKILGVDLPICSLKLEWSIENPVIKVEAGFYPFRPGCAFHEKAPKWNGFEDRIAKDAISKSNQEQDIRRREAISKIWHYWRDEGADVTPPFNIETKKLKGRVLSEYMTEELVEIAEQL